MTTIRRAALALLAVPALCGVLSADDDGVYHKINYVAVGDTPPAFELKDDQGNVWKSSRHFGKKPVVVYFYLGDFMAGCTRQACAYRDDYAAITALGAEVVGVSGDAPASHQLFKTRNHLKQTLLADEDGDVGIMWGLAWSGGGEWSVKNDEGKELTLKRGVTESRWTWIIGKDGRVIYKNMTPKPEEDSKQVLKFLTELNEREAAQR